MPYCTNNTTNCGNCGNCGTLNCGQNTQMICVPRIYSNGQCHSNGQYYASQMCSPSIPCPPAFFRYIRLKYDNGTTTSQSIISAFVMLFLQLIFLSFFLSWQLV